MLKALERLAGARHGRSSPCSGRSSCAPAMLDSIHAFGASTLGLPFLGFIAAAGRGVARARAHRGCDDLRPERAGSRCLSRETAFLVNNLVLVGLCFVIFWGTFFPLISEAVTGTKSSVGPPWFDRYMTPLALVLVLLSRDRAGAGLGAVHARGGCCARSRRRWRGAAGRARGAPGGRRGGARPVGAGMFCARRLHARRASARSSGAARSPGVASPASLCRGRRRRCSAATAGATAATPCTWASLVLLVGVAASTTFQPVRDVRLSPRADGPRRRLRRPLRRARPARSAPRRSRSGAVLDVSRTAATSPRCIPSRGYYPSLDQETFGRIGRFFNGESTSELGLRAGLARDIWTAAQPDLSAVEPMIADADRRFPDANAQLEGFVVAAAAQRYMQAAPVGRVPADRLAARGAGSGSAA